MALIRWDPFRELESMQTRLNRLFGDASFPRQGEDGMSLPGWSPAVDVQETDTEYLIKADLPDVKKEDVKVELLDGALTIKGERRQFLRRFALPNDVDAGRVQAEFKNGVLNVHLPKSAAPRPKAIEVTVSWSAGAQQRGGAHGRRSDSWQASR